MDSSISKISGHYGPDVAMYMRDIASPFLQKVTLELLKETPEDPAAHVLRFLQGMTKVPNLPLEGDKTGGDTDGGEEVAKSEPVSSIRVLHFNDVYNVEGQSREPVGGAARIVTKINELKQDPSMVLFSGDAFNPSLMSTITKGKQMVPVLNSCLVDVACMGNHDFDFGIENLESLVADCDFPWLMSNVIFKPTGRALAEGHTTVVKTIGGRKIGFIGLVEKEWMATLSTIDESDIEYEDFVVCARRLSASLRADGCISVIALTHMRVPNDARLAEEAGDCVDLICAGHDHHYDVKPVGKHGVYVLKSGTDFRDLTSLEIKFEDKEDGGVKVWVENTQRVIIDSSVPEDKEIKGVVQKFLGVLGAEMEKRVGSTNVPLEGRFQKIRTEETNLGNFIADVMRRGTDADVAILNSGTLRADCIMPVGDMKMKDLVSILPMVDETIVIEMNGPQLLKALENGVSQYPRLEGRFPQVSGVQFTFDAALEPGSRIVADSLMVGGEPMTEGRLVKVVTKAYLAKGKDGYDVFTECKVLVDEEEAPILPTLVRNTFTELSVLNGFKTLEKSVLKHAQTWRRKTFHMTPNKADEMEERLRSMSTDEELVEREGNAIRVPVGIETPQKIDEDAGFEQDEHEEMAKKAEAVVKNFTPRKEQQSSYGISPAVEGRIVCLNAVNTDV